MYWFGQSLAAVAVLLGIALVRSWVRSKWPKVHEGHLDLTLLVLLICGVSISAFIRSGELKKAAELQHTVSGLRDYSMIARLNPRGLTGTVGLGLKESSPVSRALEGAWLERDGKMSVLCDESSLKKFRRVASSWPRFPWSHYALAVCLRTREDGTWRTHAERAIEIFEVTTLLGRHHQSHNRGLEKLRGYLGTP